MKKPRYPALLGALFAKGYTQAELAAHLLLCNSSVSQRMTGKRPWLLPECYQTLDFLGVPHSEINTYFPC